MKIKMIVLLMVLIGSVTSADSPEVLNQYNVVWDQPNKDSSESMPVGGHSIGQLCMLMWTVRSDSSKETPCRSVQEFAAVHQFGFYFVISLPFGLIFST